MLGWMFDFRIISRAKRLWGLKIFRLFVLRNRMLKEQGVVKYEKF